MVGAWKRLERSGRHTIRSFTVKHTFQFAYVLLAIGSVLPLFLGVTSQVV
jgi:hypothetical protein